MELRGLGLGIGVEDVGFRAQCHGGCIGAIGLHRGYIWIMQGCITPILEHHMNMKMGNDMAMTISGLGFHDSGSGF